MSNNQANQVAINATERQYQALELRKAGATFAQIAERLGYANHTSAMKAVRSALKKTLREPADELRTMELERLDALMLPLWQSARQGNHGAVDRILKIMERRARLLGLDAPVSIKWQQTLPDDLNPDEVQRQFMELLAAASTNYANNNDA